MSETPAEPHTLEDIRRLADLEHVHEVVTRLLEQERAEPGRADDLLAQALHSSVTSWCRLRGVRI